MNSLIYFLLAVTAVLIAVAMSLPPQPRDSVAYCFGHDVKPQGYVDTIGTSLGWPCRDLELQGDA